MTKKPSYEELEKRVATLEAKVWQFDQIPGEFKRNLNFTKSLLASIPTPVFYKIRELKPPMPVVLSSGYSINGQAMKLIERGAMVLFRNHLVLRNWVEKSGKC